MIIRHYENAEAVELMTGVRKRVVIGNDEGAPNFIMRIFDLDPSASTPFHVHDWEHEIFIIQGSGAVKNAGGEETPIESGFTIFIPPNEKHCLINKGSGVMRFICLIPAGVEK
jgi:quercetin dioxygenase-like cupin family protein